MLDGMVVRTRVRCGSSHAWPNRLAWWFGGVYIICLIVCDRRVRFSLEASAQTPVVLDVDGWKIQFKVKTTHAIILCTWVLERHRSPRWRIGLS